MSSYDDSNKSHTNHPTRNSLVPIGHGFGAFILYRDVTRHVGVTEVVFSLEGEIMGRLRKGGSKPRALFLSIH